MAAEPLRVACIGMGWWSDVLADAMKRSDKFKIVACYTRSEDKQAAFAKKYGCRPVTSYEAILADSEIEAIVNTTPNDMHLPTVRAAAEAGKHVFLDKPIANNVSDGRAITACCRKAGVILAMGYQRRRESYFRWIRKQIDAGTFGKLVNAEANISRDRLGKIDLGSWRYQAAGMPGGVMLQIGIHFTDVLEYLIGPIKAVRGQFAQLVLPGDNPDVALEAWRGIAVPKSTPKPVIAALEAAIRKTVESAEFRQACARLGARPAFRPTDQFGQQIAKEDAELAKLMAMIGLKK